MRSYFFFLRILCAICLLVGSSFPTHASEDDMSVPPELIPSLERRVEEGDPQAAYALALGYRNGYVKPFNATRMLELAHMANLGGCRKADLLLSKIYADGHPWEIPRETWRGACYLNRYMYRGNPRGDVFQARLILFAALKYSVDVGPYYMDYAWDLLDNAAAQGSALAYSAIGINRYIMTNDFEKLVTNYRYASLLGDMSALGVIGFLNGDDPREVKQLLQEGVSNFDKKSMCLMGMIMLEENDPASVDQALELLREASERGFEAAQDILGRWLLDHGGDRAEAIDWIKKSAHLEFMPAQSFLDSLEE